MMEEDKKILKGVNELIVKQKVTALNKTIDKTSIIQKNQANQELIKNQKGMNFTSGLSPIFMHAQ
jgi:hypothetical protein